MTPARLRAIVAELDERDLLTTVQAVAKAHHVTVEEILGSARFPDVCRARHELWRQLQATGHWTVNRIATVFHHDHSSVSKGIKAAQGRVNAAIAVALAGAS